MDEAVLSDVNSAAVKEYMMSNPGEWVSIDNDSLKVKGFY